MAVIDQNKVSIYPELADAIELILYDEGHQFDNRTRGVTYELLLTSLSSTFAVFIASRGSAQVIQQRKA